MSLEQNKQVFLDVIERVINPGDLVAADELIDENFEIHRTGLHTTITLLSAGAEESDERQISRLDAFKQGLGMMRAAFPDWRHEVQRDSLIAEGDLVAGRWKLEATHRGNFLGIEATGRHVVMDEAGIMRIVGGKMVEGWFIGDELGFVTALDLVAIKR